ncbi:MAG: cytidine deaminase [Candidatus Comchoanobacterales bacterium]
MSPELLYNQVIHLARQSSYAPYSKCYVGSGIVSRSGKVYTGVNVENASYGLTSCAEQNAIGAMITGGCLNIDTIVIAKSDNQCCPPCGRCRQLIAEFSDSKTLIYLMHEHSLKAFSLHTLLPMHFSLDQGFDNENKET